MAKTKTLYENFRDYWNALSAEDQYRFVSELGQAVSLKIENSKQGILLQEEIKKQINKDIHEQKEEEEE